MQDEDGRTNIFFIFEKPGNSATMMENDSTFVQVVPMKTPPLLMGAALLFWGWQSSQYPLSQDLMPLGVLMGIVLESARVLKIRWELTEADFRRIATFCTLLSLTLAIYAFSTNEEGGNFDGIFRGPGAVHNAAMTTIHTATSWLRWLPISFFIFVAAQTYSTHEAAPLTVFSMYWSWRARQEKKRTGKTPPIPNINVSYPYFVVCLFSSSIHPNNGGMSFFCGECILVGWALWPFRSLRFGIPIWTLALAVSMVASYFGQQGIGLMQRYVERSNVRWMMRWMRPHTDPKESITAIGQIGELKLSGAIVMRLQTKNDDPPPTYLREASYRIYQSRTHAWFIGSENNALENVVAQGNQLTWSLVPGKKNLEAVNIACYLNDRSPDGNPQGLLPLPIGDGELDNLDAYILQKNPEGDVMAEGPGLIIFDALYGPGETIDALPDTNRDLHVPTNEAPALKQVVSEMNISTHNEQKILNQVSGFFQRNFSYSIWQGRGTLVTSTNETPLSRFLLHTRSGHCEYFATATVLLLRELKIPARYAVGYYVHEASRHGYLVRERDAHAWCLVWNARARTWEDFDTTPASWIKIEGDRSSSMQSFDDFWSWVGFQIAKFRWGQGNMRQYILWGLIPVLGALLARIVFRRGRRRQKKADGKSAAPVFWPGLDSEFYALERKLAQRGAPRPPGEPLSDWLARALENPALDDLRAPLQELLRLHYRHRFDPRGLNARERKLLQEEAKSCLEALSRTETEITTIRNGR